MFEIEGRETVTAAPELARMTLNLAMTHRDAGAGAHGRRLVYGGQTISIAAAHADRALPDLATIVAWRSCEHSAPVFEGDILSTEVTVVAKSRSTASMRRWSTFVPSSTPTAAPARSPSRCSTGASSACSPRGGARDERDAALAGILDGLRVLEGSAYVAAPLGGMTLAQLGADVIRFDPIGGGLDRNRWPVTDDGSSLFWAGLNKGKRSIQVDLRSAGGPRAARRAHRRAGPGRRASC